MLASFKVDSNCSETISNIKNRRGEKIRWKWWKKEPSVFCCACFCAKRKIAFTLSHFSFRDFLLEILGCSALFFGVQKHITSLRPILSSSRAHQLFDVEFLYTAFWIYCTILKYFDCNQPAFSVHSFAWYFSLSQFLSHFLPLFLFHSALSPYTLPPSKQRCPLERPFPLSPINSMQLFNFRSDSQPKFYIHPHNSDSICTIIYTFSYI